MSRENLEIKWFYVFVRQDVPLHVQLIQSVHAGIMGAKSFGVPEYHHLVLCGVPNVPVLHKVQAHLEELGFQYYTFFEPDDDLGLTALCTRQIAKDERKFLRGYPLWQADGSPWQDYIDKDVPGVRPAILAILNEVSWGIEPGLRYLADK